MFGKQTLPIILGVVAVGAAMAVVVYLWSIIRGIIAWA